MPDLRRLVLLAACLAVALPAGSSPARGAKLVVFRDWRTLLADDITERDGQALIRLGEGNELAVPLGSIHEVREHVPPAPSVPADRATPPPDGPPPAGWRERAGRHADAVAASARRHGLDPALLAAVALTESRFDTFALSRRGAQGIMQLMPATARQLRVDDVWDGPQNIDAGARWLKRLLERFGGDLDLALAAYNAGEEVVQRHGGIPPFAETRAYVERVRAAVTGFLTAERDDPSRS